MAEQSSKHVAEPLQKPLLPACFLHWTEPANEAGEETLRLASWRRHLALQGKSFQEFEQEVIPLLDGTRDIDEICERVAHLFAKEDLLTAFATLRAQGVLIEGADYIRSEEQIDRTPQQGWLAETAPAGLVAQGNLQAAKVVLFGAGAHGAVVARALVAAGIGRLTIIDPTDVAPTDLYFSGLFQAPHVGANRAEVLCGLLDQAGGSTQLTPNDTRPSDPSEVVPLISGANLVLCCLESGEQVLALYLNMACKASGTPWIAASLEGTALVVGPGFFRHDIGACYMCWKMREFAAAPNQIAHNATQAYLNNAQFDLSDRRENLAVAADIVGGMLGAEAISWLSGTSIPNLDGRFLQIGIPGLKVEKHAVLRVPGCPACDAAQATA
ncbi:MAG: TOMM precursor leader peptide-binding protein [Pseudomonadota bacterium]